jgi:predicted dehydrogenase
MRRLGLSPSLLVDPDPSRLAEVRHLCPARGVPDFAAALDDFDAAIVAVPAQFHAPVCTALLDAGKHVLVEKPLAPSSAEAESLLQAQARSTASLHVGHMRRFLDVNRWVRALLRAGALGPVRSISIEEGAISLWEPASDTHLKPGSSGGGVLLDIGVHVLDTLGWWLGDLEIASYEDDNFGGVEANAVAKLRANGDVSIDVELSRVRVLRNTARLRGDAGTLEVSLHTNHVLEQPRLPRALRPRLRAQAWEDLFVEQLAAWLAAVAGRPSDSVSATDGAKTVGLAEGLYTRRSLLELPWLAPALDRA